MRVLFVNEFTKIDGGVVTLINNEINYLEKMGVNVDLLSLDHSKFLEASFSKKTNEIIKLIIPRLLEEFISERILEYKPDIIHFHNIYPLWGYPIWEVTNKKNVRLIQHLHNYNPFCINSFFYRDNGECFKCLKENNLFHGVKNKCYNNSFFYSFLSYYLRPSPLKWILSSEKIDLFFAVSNSLKNKYINAGIDGKKIKVLSNAIELDSDNVKNIIGEYVLYLGNVVEEKGAKIFCEVAKKLSEINFILAGDGRDLVVLKNIYNDVSNLKFIGFISGKDKNKLLRECRFLMFPSLCWESFGISIIEAFSFGKPVLASGMGAIKEVVEENKTGVIIQNPIYTNFSRETERLWKLIQKEGNIFFENCINTAKNHEIETHTEVLKKYYDEALMGKKK